MGDGRICEIGPFKAKPGSGAAFAGARGAVTAQISQARETTMEKPKGKDDVKVEDLPPKKLGVEQEAVKGGALAAGALTGRILQNPDIFP
jgi:hypothetical protein